MSDFEITLPPRANINKAMDAGLVQLTEAIAKIDPNLVSHGCLGGEFGYGARYENDVFMMHPYCWCECADCPWCRSCECELGPAPEYKTIKECINCSDNPPTREPNFYHKKSGLTVWWYKWIGRGMEIEGHRGVSLRQMFNECLKSLPVTP